MLFIAYALIGVWGVVMFQNRRGAHLYFALVFCRAFFWFRGSYTSANLIVGSPHIHGVVHGRGGVVRAGLLGYFFASVGSGDLLFDSQGHREADPLL